MLGCGSGVKLKIDTSSSFQKIDSIIPKHQRLSPVSQTERPIPNYAQVREVEL